MQDLSAYSEYGRLEVREIVQETCDCRSILLAPPGVARPGFVPHPGQFLTLQVEVDGRTYRRCYSVSSSHLGDEPLRITVKRQPGGVVSSFLNDTTKVGDQLMCAPPLGQFVLRPEQRDVLFFAAGSGITPILPMIRQAIEVERRRVSLLYWNRSPEDVIFADDLRSFARSRTNFEMFSRFGSRGDPAQIEEINMVAARHPEPHVYICGPEGFMALVRSTLRRRGVGEDSIFEERFCVTAGTAQPAPAPGGDAYPVTVKVVRNRAHFLVAGNTRNSLLDAMLSSGLSVPHLCKAGECSHCIVRLIEGTVDAKRGAALSRRDREKGMILACQSWPTSSEIELSYDV